MMNGSPDQAWAGRPGMLATRSRRAVGLLMRGLIAATLWFIVGWTCAWIGLWEPYFAWFGPAWNISSGAFDREAGLAPYVFVAAPIAALVVGQLNPVSGTARLLLSMNLLGLLALLAGGTTPLIGLWTGAVYQTALLVWSLALASWVRCSVRGPADRSRHTVARIVVFPVIYWCLHLAIWVLIPTPGFCGNQSSLWWSLAGLHPRLAMACCDFFYQLPSLCTLPVLVLGIPDAGGRDVD
jgi:hypothetical protein